MAAPLFFAVGGLVGSLADYFEKKSDYRGLYSFAPLLLLTLEGVDPHLSFSRAELVEGRATVDLSFAQMRQRMDSIPPFQARQPLFLQMGFPQPASVEGKGLAPGSARRIHFAGAAYDNLPSGQEAATTSANRVAERIHAA